MRRDVLCLKPLPDSDDVWPVSACRPEERVGHAQDGSRCRLMRVDEERKGGVVDVKVGTEVAAWRKLEF